MAFDSYHRMRDGRFTWMLLEPMRFESWAMRSVRPLNSAKWIEKRLSRPAPMTGFFMERQLTIAAFKERWLSSQAGIDFLVSRTTATPRIAARTPAQPALSSRSRGCRRDSRRRAHRYFAPRNTRPAP